MNRSTVLPARPIWLVVLSALLLFVGLFSARPTAAQDFVLEWDQIGFVDGTSTPQTFLDINGSGVNMTIDFRVFGPDFADLGTYVPGTTPLNANKPQASGGDLEVRDINVGLFPNAGYIQTRMVFSQDVYISDLWMESFYHWTQEDVMKHAALQAFDADGNGLVPESWEIYGGGSQMVVATHPGNNEPWWRSDFPVPQTVFTGVQFIDFGNQPIRELRWYSWGQDPVTGALRHVLGSTALGEFSFSTTPTAVNLQSFTPAASAMPVAGLVGFLALALVSFGVVIVRRERR